LAHCRQEQSPSLLIRTTVGIFSLFGKKESQSARKPSDRDSSQKKRDKDALDVDTKIQMEQVQRKAARAATAMKIDEIESEMSSEFVKPLPFSGNTMPGPISQFMDTAAPRTVPNTAVNPSTRPSQGKDGNTIPLEQTPTLPMMGESTAFLLSAETLPGPVAISASEAAPVIEEAAILYANGQTTMIEPILLHAIQEDAPPTVWSMLLDLYQITGQRISFENLAIDYAQKFETSPPAWIEGDGTQEKTDDAPRAGTTPSVAFSGKLDSGIVKQLERIKNMAEISNVIKLEFARVAEVDPIGCGLLLSVLKKLQKSGHKLILVGAAELAEKIRSILMVGRRDETEAPWLLMLELLRLLNRETEFEESSIDYCITFEVSPPAFVSPQDKVVTDTEETAPQDESASDRCPLPAVIDGNAAQVLKDIVVYAHAHNPVVLDCAGLKRMDFGAAGQLFNGLMPLISSGKRVELYHPNQFIIALCAVMGFKDLLHIVPRKS
jgi:ABC-type transporter Mla MlaB component